MTDVTGRLVDHALSVEWSAISPEAQRAALNFVHDSLCVGVAGAKAPYADIMARAVSGWSGNGGARVLGRDMRLPGPDAAFLNGFQIHCQEFDCVHEAAVLHPMATLLAAVLAECDRGHAYSGSELLSAVVAGVDVSTTLGLAVTTPLRFFRPATAGIFGSVAAICRLRRLSPEVTRHAFGYALSFSSGTMQAHLEGLPALPVQVAGAARSAVQAVELAVAGMPGVHASIDGPFGYLSLFEGGFEWGNLLDELGTVHRIAQVSWKPFPTGRAGQGAIVGTRELMDQHGVTADGLEKLTVSAPPLIARLVGRPIKDEMTPAYARLCFPYLGALVLLRGAVTLDDFTPERLADPQVHALARRIVVEANDNPDPAAFVPATLTALMNDGRTAEVHVQHQLGAPDNPLSREQHLEKAQGCLAFAGYADAHDTLTAMIETLPNLPDVRGLLDLLSVPARP